MDNPDKHLFHFVMDRGMKKDLQKLDLYKNSGGLSGVIVKIFSLLLPYMRKEHKWGEERKSRYLPVCDNPDEVRDHVQVYFPEEIYREVKLLHADLNCFSIAQLVRGFLRLFLDLVKEYGNFVFQELKKIFKRWKDEDCINHLTNRKIIQQLSLVLQHFSGKNTLINIYNRHFSPSWIFLL